MRITKGIKEEYREICQMAGCCSTCMYAVEGLVEGSLTEFAYGCSHPKVIKAAEPSSVGLVLVR